MTIKPEPELEEIADRYRLKPIYLLADSQLLFWRDNSRLFLESLWTWIGQDSPKAVYIGASNGDNPEFYSIFEAAMQGIGIYQNRMVPSAFSIDDAAFISQADIILLAGGNDEEGWRIFEQSGLGERILRRYYGGGLLIGVSAGAVQLGARIVSNVCSSPDELIKTFELVPLIISAHDEGREWESLKRTVQISDNGMPGIGISSGGGAIYYADRSIEPIRHPLREYTSVESQLIDRLLWPATEAVIDAPEVC